MPKLTVFFKLKAIDSYLFDNGLIHIGSDESNELHIDSLAIAPVHAVIAYHDGINTIKQLDENFPVLVNGKKIQAAALQDNDRVILGKHELLFHTTESVSDPMMDAPIERSFIANQNSVDEHTPIANASLQVLNGENIGKLFLLKKAMTRIGTSGSGSGVVVIAKRKEGYFVSALENPESILVNKRLIHNTFLKLDNNDVLDIGGTAFQFFFS
jgi:hypothetical protein